MLGFRFLLLILIFIPSISLSNEFRRSFISWGTNLDFIIRSDLNEEKVNFVVKEVQLIPSSLELIFNSKNIDSELFKINNLQSDKEIIISSDFIFLLKKSIYYNQITNGYFDPTAGYLTLEGDRRNNSDISKCIGLENLIINFERSSLIKKKNCLKIDLDGIAEGYAISLMLLKFKEYGIKDVLINFGGNVSTLSYKTKWEISIRNPQYIYSINSTYDLNNLSVSTSSQYSQLIKKNDLIFSHILDPIKKTLKPKENISFSVIGEDPIYADAISTALQAMPLEEALAYLKKTNNIKALVLSTDENMKTEVLFNNFE